jgi:hypothetical protein
MYDDLFTQRYPAHHVQEECPWQLSYKASVIVELEASWKCKFTFPIFTVGAIFTDFLTIILCVAIPVDFA